jgi:hypothetical protein
MKNIVEKCIEWNAARYEREYSHILAVKLLLEETNELFNARILSEQLDAIGDITFVAIGVMWKAGIPSEIITKMFYDFDLSKLTIEECYDLCCSIHNTYINNTDPKADINDALQGVDFACSSTFITAIGTLRGLGMQNCFYEIVHAICDSNDTKEIKGKVSANIKANINKGSNYIPPTETLNKIITVHYRENTRQ